MQTLSMKHLSKGDKDIKWKLLSENKNQMKIGGATVKKNNIIYKLNARIVLCIKYENNIYTYLISDSKLEKLKTYSRKKS